MRYNPIYKRGQVIKVGRYFGGNLVDIKHYIIITPLDDIEGYRYTCWHIEKGKIEEQISLQPSNIFRDEVIYDPEQI